MVNVAIFGMGFMGQTHLKAYLKMPGVKVVGISDADPARAKGDFAGTWGNLGDGKRAAFSMEGVTGTTDWRELLKLPGVDAVDVCLPTPAHAEAAIAALEAGKHVVCEKPIGRDVAEVKSVAIVAANARGFFMPAMCMRFWPQWVWLKNAVESGQYGKVLSAAFRRCASAPPGWFNKGNLSGGGILDLHIHDTDFVKFLFGTPMSVSSRGYSRSSGKIDHIVTQYAYEKTPLVYAEGGWTHAEGFPFTMRYTVNFENATADFDISRTDQLLLIQDGKATPVQCEGTDGYDGELGYFVECVKGNKAPVIVTIADAMESTRILEAEARSAETGQPITLR